MSRSWRQIVVLLPILAALGLPAKLSPRSAAMPAPRGAMAAETTRAVWLPLIIDRSGVPVTPTLTQTPTTQASATATQSSTETATPSTTPTEGATPTESATPTPTQTSATGPCLCTGDLYNCGDFGTQAQAQECFDHCWAQTGKDIHRLDSDKDGIACEGLP